MRSTQQHNPMVDLVQYQLETSMHLAEAVFSGTEKIDRAMLDVTHEAVDSQLKLARAVTNMRDPSHMAELQLAIASRPEKAMHCQQQIMSALVELQAEFGKSMKNYLDRLTQTSPGQFGQFGKQLQGFAEEAGAEARRNAANPTINPLTGMLSVWEDALRQVSSLASQNMMAARSNMENAAHAAQEAVSQTLETSHTTRPRATTRKRQGSAREKA